MFDLRAVMSISRVFKRKLICFMTCHFMKLMKIQKQSFADVLQNITKLLITAFLKNIPGGGFLRGLQPI